MMLEHLEYLLPDLIERNHVVDLMHFLCVKPEVKINFALLLQGQQGTGKTAIGVLLRRIIGSNNVAEPSSDELKERWTKWQEGASLFTLLVACSNGDIQAKKLLDEMDDLDVYGHLTAKKVVMLVRLYFPNLSRIHQFLFAAERQLNQQVWNLSTGEAPKLEFLLVASGKVGHMLRLMEQEMVANQSSLLRGKVFLRSYKSATSSEIEDVPPPPDGPPLAGMRPEK